MDIDISSYVHVSGSVLPVLEQFYCEIYGLKDFSLTDPDDPFKITDQTRNLGLVVCRGTAVVLICPSDSMEQIANPFLQMPEEL